MIRIGCIADDFTGGTDVAAALRRAGLSVALLFGVPEPGAPVPATDAVVIALKTRTVPAVDAVRTSLEALTWLRAHDVDRVYFKYCSTFDSTPDGNIGPVADALLGALGESLTLICPASPEHARTVYRGHLFVGDDLLSESSMAHHPLTPMTDARLARVLAHQTDGTVGHLPLTVVRQGPDAIATHLKELKAQGVRHVVVDAVDPADLEVVAEGSRDLRLLTGGASLAGALGPTTDDGATPVEVSTPEHMSMRGGSLPEGPCLILAGSCSATTLEQVALARGTFDSYRLDPGATPDPEDMLARATRWLDDHLGDRPVMIYSSAGPDERRVARAAMGDRTADVLEDTLGRLARRAVARGAARIVVAGGETSGAVVQALGVDTVLVAGEEDRGVPWCLTPRQPPLALLLKSGNFGAPDLLVRAATKETS